MYSFFFKVALLISEFIASSLSFLFFNRFVLEYFDLGTNSYAVSVTIFLVNTAFNHSLLFELVTFPSNTSGKHILSSPNVAFLMVSTISSLVTDFLFAITFARALSFDDATSSRRTFFFFFLSKVVPFVSFFARVCFFLVVVVFFLSCVARILATARRVFGVGFDVLSMIMMIEACHASRARSVVVV